MRRKTFDALLISGGLVLAIVLLVAGGMLVWASSFIGDQVKTQLSEQKIFFPPKGNPAIKGPQFVAMQQYAGQQLVTGPQAETYADHFIAVHLSEVAGGKTYSQVSTEAMAKPNDATLQGQVATLFKGTTLRGLLLNAYAFSKFGQIAGIASYVLFGGAAIMLVLSGLGLVHARKVRTGVEVSATDAEAETKAA